MKVFNRLNVSRSLFALALPLVALSAIGCNGKTLRSASSAVGASTALADPGVASSSKTESDSILEGTASSPAPEAAKLDIVQTALAAGKFNTLAAALQAADLVATLQGPGPFTVFAPTDEAFAKLPAGTVDALLKDKAALTSVLLLHVSSGTFSADRIFLRKSVKTLAGVVGTTTNSGAVNGLLQLSSFVNGRGGQRVNVVQEDVRASNGIIQVIDTVLLNPRASGH
ncbi:MAG: fasciclin domain-containing protein [Silvanigrellales bacterium]|jgi:uncharacterized surface protein with fasciclin (FAS1) repeats|nr:fasciclin domain-containing protein [Silvanigrellales bacterium]